jgi:hypothetical protein
MAIRPSGTIGTIRRQKLFPRPPCLTVSAKALLCIALLAATLVAAGAQPAAAAGAKKPAPACWKTLLNDWYDGRIDGTYPIHCYRDALKHLPSDVDTYSSARSDIERALQSARAAARKVGRALAPNTLIQPATANGNGKKRRHPSSLVVQTSGREKDKGLAGLADKLNPSSPSALPLPLLVLGGLALLLVAAGGVGLVLKQLQARKPGP